MKHAGLNMEQVKINNRSSILKYINDVGPVSRKDIAIATGLTPSAVTQICTVLIQEKLLTELGTVEEPSGAGRKKVLVDLDVRFLHVLTINIESEETVIAVSDIKGGLIKKETLATDGSVSPEKFLKKISAKCREVMESPECAECFVKGASVAIPGLVDKEKGLSVHAYGLWEEEVEVCRILREELGMTVVIENNVNAFALAELLFGTGRSYDNFLLVKWGPGVGSSIIIDNKIYEGRHGRAAELGHYIVDASGDKCSCGNYGCLETKVSYHALQQIVKFDQSELGKVYESADFKVKESLDQRLEIFALALVNTVTTLAPNRVVLCGKLFRDGIIRERLFEKCQKLSPRLDRTRILFTEMFEKEDFVGPVACFAQEKVFN